MRSMIEDYFRYESDIREAVISSEDGTWLGITSKRRDTSDPTVFFQR